VEWRYIQGKQIMNKSQLISAILAFTALTSHAESPLVKDSLNKCKKGCNLIFLTVPHDGKPGQKVVRDAEGGCWQSTFDLEETEDPNVKSQRMLSNQAPIDCGKTPI
jgi:hypothetical protein